MSINIFALALFLFEHWMTIFCTSFNLGAILDESACTTNASHRKLLAPLFRLFTLHIQQCNGIPIKPRLLLSCNFKNNSLLRGKKFLNSIKHNGYYINQLNLSLRNLEFLLHCSNLIYLLYNNYIILYYIILYYIILYYIILYYIISYHTISYHIISYIISYHIISYHIISYHIVSYHII